MDRKKESLLYYSNGVEHIFLAKKRCEPCQNYHNIVVVLRVIIEKDIVSVMAEENAAVVVKSIHDVF